MLLWIFVFRHKTVCETNTRSKWDEVFESGLSKCCGRQSTLEYVVSNENRVN